MDWNLELKRYAAGLAYFMIKSLGKADLDSISSVILFGSVSQDRAGKDSDVDVFIDTSLPHSRTRKLRSILNRKKEEFMLSGEGLSYKRRGIYNPINLVVGSLDKWDDMKRSLSSGIVLYGSFNTGFEKKGLKHSIIFFWEGEGRKRGAFLNKLYGLNVNGKRYQGAIEKFDGTKIGKSAAMIPAGHAKEFMKIMEQYNISYRAIEVFV